jgi:hypothetical protein
MNKKCNFTCTYLKSQTLLHLINFERSFFIGVGAVEPVVDGPDEIFPAERVRERERERERESIILLEIVF